MKDKIECLHNFCYDRKKSEYDHSPLDHKNYASSEYETQRTRPLQPADLKKSVNC